MFNENNKKVVNELLELYRKMYDIYNLEVNSSNENFSDNGKSMLLKLILEEEEKVKNLDISFEGLSEIMDFCCDTLGDDLLNNITSCDVRILALKRLTSKIDEVLGFELLSDVYRELIILRTIIDSVNMRLDKLVVEENPLFYLEMIDVNNVDLSDDLKALKRDYDYCKNAMDNYPIDVYNAINYILKVDAIGMLISLMDNNINLKRAKYNLLFTTPLIEKERLYNGKFSFIDKSYIYSKILCLNDYLLEIAKDDLGKIICDSQLSILYNNDIKNKDDIVIRGLYLNVGVMLLNDDSYKIYNELTNLLLNKCDKKIIDRFARELDIYLDKNCDKEIPAIVKNAILSSKLDRTRFKRK